MSDEFLRSLPILIMVGIFVGIGVVVGLSLKKEKNRGARKRK